MITTTLGELRRADPCSESWFAFLKRTGIDNATAPNELVVPFPETSDLLELFWCMKTYSEYDYLWYEYALAIYDLVKDFAPEIKEKTSMKYGWLSAFKTQNYAENAYVEHKVKTTNVPLESARQEFVKMSVDKLHEICRGAK